MSEKRKTDSLGREMVRYSVQGGANEIDTTRARQVLGYTYPIDLVPGDRRLSDALVRDFCTLLVQHGYPVPQPGRDDKRMRRVLFSMLYRQDVE